MDRSWGLQYCSQRWQNPPKLSFANAPQIQTKARKETQRSRLYLKQDGQNERKQVVDAVRPPLH